MVPAIGYVGGAERVKSGLIRAGHFGYAATSVLALLPIIARPHGATGYGVLLTSFGLGALAGAAALPRLKERLSIAGNVAIGLLLVAGKTFAARQVKNFGRLCAVFFAAGTAWIRVATWLKPAAQHVCP